MESLLVSRTFTCGTPYFRLLHAPTAFNGNIYIAASFTQFHTIFCVCRIGELGDGGKYVCGFEFYDQV
jgi:hypothetical protein